MICDNCALRLINDKAYNLQGVGNPLYGNAIIIPNVDYKAYRKKQLLFGDYVKEIQSSLSSTGELNNIYITPLLHCKVDKIYPVNDDIIINCSKILEYEFKKYNFKRVLILGSAVEKLMRLDLSKFAGKTLFYKQKGIYYTLSYSPLIKHSNNNLYKLFKLHLLKWYENVINKNNNYDYIL